MKNSAHESSRRSVGILTRVSTFIQADLGYSLDQQEGVCRDYLNRVMGPGNYTARLFADEGFSGKKGFAKPGSSAKNVRPGLSALVRAIVDGEIDSVVFWRLDRLSRSARVWHEFLQDYILQYNITLISVQDGIDTSSSMGRFAAGILVLAAELFADITSENVKAAMARRREDGYPTGQVGYGWVRTAKEEDDD